MRPRPPVQSGPGAVRWIASSAPAAAASALDLVAREDVRLLAQTPEDDAPAALAGGPRRQLAQHRHHRGDAGAGRREDDVARVHRVENEETVRSRHGRRSLPSGSAIR